MSAMVECPDCLASKTKLNDQTTPKLAKAITIPLRLYDVVPGPMSVTCLLNNSSTFARLYVEHACSFESLVSTAWNAILKFMGLVGC